MPNTRNEIATEIRQHLVILAGYIAENINKGMSFEDALEQEFENGTEGKKIEALAEELKAL